jgi:anti-anti-sigma factor
MPSDGRARSRKTWQLGVTQDRRAGVLILALTGRLGVASAPELARLLGTAIDGGERSILVDLAGVDYLSSACLVTLQTASARLRDSTAELILCGMDTPVRLVFDLAGILEGFAVEPSRDLALRRLEGNSTAAPVSRPGI